LAEVRFAFPLAAGLHARPASLLRDACRPFAAAVAFRNLRNGRRADAASVLELVASDTAGGDPCLLQASGPQEREAAAALSAFVERVLPGADDGPSPAADAGGSSWLPPVFAGSCGALVRGRPLAPGLGRGRLMRRSGRASFPKRFAAGARDATRELELFRQAAADVEAALAELSSRAAGPVAAIFKAQQAIAADPGFAGRVADLIARGRLSAGAAIEKAAGHYAGLLRRSASAYLRERANDVHDIAAQLAEKLYGAGSRPAPPDRGPFILAAASLSACELPALARRGLRGLILVGVGSTAHVSILARALSVPAVSVEPGSLARIADHAEALVDGRRGLALIAPGAALKRYYRLEERAAEEIRRRRGAWRRRRGRTRDGQRVEVAANVGRPEELASAWAAGAEGIGLLRSEFLFLGRHEPPGEEEQFAAYARAARSGCGRPVIVRTLDVGGDKPLPYLKLPPEANPFLGRRAVRFYAEQAGLLRCQLRAMLRAARCGRMRIMVPMVSVPGEVRLVRGLLAEAAAELRRRRVPHARALKLGIMVETPAAALTLDSLAREADFFSVGSNDLLQYVTAADRGDPSLAGISDPLHPAFLRLLAGAARQARRARRWLGLCGEMAGNADLLPLLAGIGFDELSMAPGLIPETKERLAGLDAVACRRLLGRALRCGEAAEVRALLREFAAGDAAAARRQVFAAGLVRLGSASRSAAEAIRELCAMLELDGRVHDALALEEAVWKREETYATDLGLGFALPHAKSPAVREAAVAFLRPARAMRWAGKGGAPVRGVLLIAVPEGGGEEHLRLIAGLSRRLVHGEFRRALLGARSAAAALAVLRSGLDPA
jgi:fructose-specific PTS system IIA-like component